MRFGTAQSSMEFLLLVGIAFSAAVILVSFSVNEIKEFTDQKEFLLVKDMALKLQKEVTLASSVEDGYKRTFTLPDKLESTVDYSIITLNTTITVNSSKSVFSAAIPVVNGEFIKGSNTIRKANGTIFVND